MKYLSNIILFFIISFSLHQNAYAEYDQELLKLAERLFQSTPIECQEINSECYCLKHETKTNFPLRSTQSKFCRKEISPGKIGYQFTSWDEKGNIVDEGYYFNGKLSGECVNWYPNGAKESEGQFVDGEPIGLFTGWHDDGSIAFQGEYKKGKPDGTWQYWDKDGKIIKMLKWENGVLKSKDIME